MADAIELATAYVQLVPSLKGAQGQIASELIPEVSGAGDKAAVGFGAKFKAGLDKLGGGKALTLGLVGGIAASFVGLFAIGSEFDKLSDTIRITTGASGQNLDALVQVAKNVGSTVPDSFDKIGPVVAGLNQRLGLTGDTLQTVAGQYLEASRAFGQTVDINTTSAAFTAFGIQGDKVSGAMDALFRASQASGLSMNDLAAAAQKNAPMFQTMGFSFEEAAGMAGLLDKAGMNSQATLTAMGKGMVTLAKQGEQPQEAMKRVTGQIVGFIKAGDEAGALNLAAKLFGTKGAAQMVKALQDGTINADSLTASLSTGTDTIMGMAEDTASFSESWQLVKNNAQLALEPIATTLFQGVSDALSGFMPKLQAFGQWFADNQWVIGVVAGIIGVTLVAAFFSWAASIWASTIALLANPVTWIILGIIALGAAIVLLVQNWDTVVAWLSSVWGAAVNWVKGTFDNIKAWAESIFGSVADFFVGLWTSISNGATTAWNTVSDFLVVTIWGGLKRSATDTWEGIKLAVLTPIFWVRDQLTSVWTTILSGVENMGRGVKEKFSSAFESLSGIIKAPVNAAIGVINLAIGRLNGIHVSIPDWVPFVGGKSFGVNLPTISYLASGGTVMPRAGGTLAILGEAGRPETVVDTGGVNRMIEQVNARLDIGESSEMVGLLQAMLSLLMGGITVTDPAVAQRVEKLRSTIGGGRITGRMGIEVVS